MKRCQNAIVRATPFAGAPFQPADMVQGQGADRPGGSVHVRHGEVVAHVKQLVRRQLGGAQHICRGLRVEGLLRADDQGWVPLGLIGIGVCNLLRRAPTTCLRHPPKNCLSMPCCTDCIVLPDPMVPGRIKQTNFRVSH